jgi:hypothetical protein
VGIGWDEQLRAGSPHFVSQAIPEIHKLGLYLSTVFSHSAAGADGLKRFKGDLTAHVVLFSFFKPSPNPDMADQGTRFATDKAEVNELEKGSTLAPTASQRSTGYAASTAGLDHKSETSKAERKLLFKLDILILPLAMLLYLSAYLVRVDMA